MSNKDWTGNSNSIYKTLGASSHTDKVREEYDFYATEPKAAQLLLEVENFSLEDEIWECAVGAGHLSKVFEDAGYKVRSTDLIYRGVGEGNVDFLACNNTYKGNIITNPPYKYAKEFCEHALEIVEEGYSVAMFLKLQFLEGKARKEFFAKYPPKHIYVSSSRLLCAKNGEFEKMKEGGGSAVAYAWFVWEKGYVGEPTIRWIN